MITYDQAQTISQKLAQDSSSSAVTQLNLMMNVGYKHILNALGRQVTEKVKTASTVADQREYQVPPDCAWVKNVSIINGTNKVVLDEVQSEKIWDDYTLNDFTGLPQRYFYRPRFGLGGGLIELDPIPGASTYTIRLTCESNDKDLSKSAYSTGTISINSGSASVTGSGTTFTSDMVGRYLQITADGHDRLFYRIKTFTSTTVIVLENVYEGTSNASGVAYQIVELFQVPEEMQMLPIYYSLWHWWETKKDTNYATKYRALWEDGLARAKTWHATKTRDNVVRYDDFQSPFSPAMPPWFPSDGVTP